MYCGMYWYVSCTYDVLVPTNTYPYGHQYVDQYAQNTCQYGHQCLPIRYHYMPLRAPLGAGYIACDSPYNLAPPPRGPGGTARARQCRARRARPAGPRAHGGAAPRSSDDATASSWGLSAPANASRRSNAFTVLAPRLLTKARRGSHRQPKINYQQRNNNQSRMLQSIAWCLFRRHYQ